MNDPPGPEPTPGQAPQAPRPASGQAPVPAPGAAPQPAQAPSPESAPGAAPQAPGPTPDQPPPYTPGTPPATGLPQPPSIRNAVRLMYVGAGFATIGALQALTMRDTMGDLVEEELRRTPGAFDRQTIDAVVTGSWVVAVLVSLIGVALWVWMAYANGKGHQWARVVATILFALQALSVLFTLSNVAMLGMGPAMGTMGIFVTLLNLVLGGTIIYFLYRPESTAFYRRGRQ